MDRLGPRQPLLDDGLACCAHGRMRGDGREEVVALERIKLRVDERPDGCGAWDVSKQRDLAEVAAFAHRCTQSVCDDLELTLRNDVEPISSVAGANHDVAR